MLLDTPICDFGWKAPDFTLSDPEGETINLYDSLGEQGALVAFICNHCPYVQAIADRLAADARELMSDGISVLAVMSNDFRRVPSDSPAAMAAFARAHDFPFPYLVDEGQKVGRAFGAVCTPDFFGFNAAGELQYRGRLDDTQMRDRPDRKRELVQAMKLIAETGQGPRDQTQSMGCSIKWS